MLLKVSEVSAWVLGDFFHILCLRKCLVKNGVIERPMKKVRTVGKMILRMSLMEDEDIVPNGEH